MSAPTTNVEKQKKRHAGVLSWMAICVAIVVVMFGIFYAMTTSDDPAETAPTAPAVTEEAS